MNVHNCYCKWEKFAQNTTLWQLLINKPGHFKHVRWDALGSECTGLPTQDISLLNHDQEQVRNKHVGPRVSKSHTPHL